ncbi:hypothetical protein A5764_05445 [Mycobacterium sp. 852002-51057_SCH5723018]|nr:hypothetical protein A5764_05445 [Mycobacterium sp. 852002-51057_SCH5723018]
MTGTATDARQASCAAGNAAGAGELAAGAAADAWHAALPARPAAGAVVLAAGAAIAVGVAATAARVVLEDNVRGRGRVHRWTGRKNIGGGRWGGGDSRSNSPGHHQWFHEG